MPTPRQEKLINLLVENLGKLGNTKSLGEIILEAGYSKAMAKNPYQILESETIQEGIGDFVDSLDKLRKRALKHITQKKLEKSSAKDLTQIADLATKNHQLLTGKETERGEIQVKGFNYIKPDDPNNQTHSETTSSV